LLLTWWNRIVLPFKARVTSRSAESKALLDKEVEAWRVS
jgi:hypothetical protein